MIADTVILPSHGSIRLSRREGAELYARENFPRSGGRMRETSPPSARIMWRFGANRLFEPTTVPPGELASPGGPLNRLGGFLGSQSLLIDQ